jgi:DNA-binding beta-propeller fold protein YncE
VNRTTIRCCGNAGLAIAGTLLFCLLAFAAEIKTTTTPLPIPGGAGGIGFDDLGFSAALHKVIVPAGRTGKLDLIDPESKQIEEIGGFSAQTAYGGGHGEGVTSADTGRNLIFVTDRSSKTLNVLDPNSKKIVATARLAAGPDYVRYVAPTGEVWVTEPRAAQIEIFSLPAQGAPQPSHSAAISVPNGPESLVIDEARARAYTNSWTDSTIAIDLRKREIGARWLNGCHGSRGIALDSEHAHLFVGCEEGKLAVLDVKDGHKLGEASSGAGVDIIAYNPKLHHAYLPGAESATMALIGISAGGSPKVLGTVAAEKGSHCVTTDDRDNAYICDPAHGRLLVLHDSGDTR